MNSGEFNAILAKLRNKEIGRDEAGALLHALKTRNKSSRPDYAIADEADIALPLQSGGKQIAVIGMAGQFPGASDVDTFWRNLLTGRDVIGALPAHYRSGESGPDELCRGGYVEERGCFDPLFFNISPLEAEAMHPHQRLILQESWKALEDAGYNPKSLADAKVGLYIGAEPIGYFHDSFTGSSEALIASRLSYYLNLKGPALVVNTGCSSSGVAIHLACESLRNAESDMALAGGVFAMLDQGMLKALAKIGMLSPSHCCNSFDAAADGTAFSEGVAMVVLKRLEDAIADGDPVYAVIEGSGINQDGASNGITAPNGVAQEALIADVYRRYRINPEHIGCVEAHGTGTRLGDPVEANALVRAFKQFTGKAHYCALGSVKAHIGHTSASAAVIGLIKLILSIKHRKIPGLPHFKQLNPLIALQGSAFYVNAETRDWQAPGGMPLMAALSSFGHSGTNVHLVLREYLPPQSGLEARKRPGEAVLIPLSAKTEESLNATAEKLARFLDDEPGLAVDLLDLAYTLQTGREAMSERAVFLVENKAELAAKLLAFSKGCRDIENCKTSRVDDSLEAPGSGAVASGPGQLAEAWLQGATPDWPSLYRVAKPRRLHLPTYAFAKDYYWGGGNTVVDAPSAWLHPLLQQNTSDFLAQRYSSTFSGQEFFFAGHRVHGQKVLPGVAYLEMAAAAIHRSAGHWRQDGAALRLSRIFWIRPMVADAGSVTAHIALTAEDGGRIRYEIYTDAGQHSQGEAQFIASREPPFVDLQALQVSIKHDGPSPERCYQIFNSAGVVHGAEFQCLRELRIGHRQVLAKLIAQESQDAYLLPPGLMDAALQAALGLETDAGGQAMLPFALESLDIFAPCKPVLWCWIRPSDDGPAARALKLDIDLCDEQGRLCVSMKGFSSRVLAAAGLDRRDDSAEIQCLAPVWSEIPAQTLEREAHPIEATLLLGGTKAQHEALRRVCPGAKALTLPSGATITAISDALKNFEPIVHLVWIAPDAADIPAMIDAQQQGVIAVFRIIKALLALGYGVNELTWTFITELTQPVRGAPVNPAHAAVHGLVGSLAKEYPHWRTRLFDLEAFPDWPVDDIFSLLVGPGGDALAYRRNEWYRQALLPLKPVESDGRSPYRYRGVYVVLGGAGGIGAVWSRHLIEHYRAQIVWIGRREKDEQIQAKLDELAAIGAAPHYIAADATNREAMEQAYREIKQRYRSIQGVVHSAIVLKDQGLAGMDEAAFQAGLAAKVDTSVHLARVFADEPLDFMLFFSSVVAFGKVAGQSNYAAGSTFKDAFALKLAQEAGYAVKIINWGYWGTVGIVAAPEYQARMQRAGLGSIMPEEGMAAVNQLLTGSLPQLAMLKTLNPGVLPSVNSGLRLADYPESIPSVIMTLRQTLAQRDYPVAAQITAGGDAIKHIEARLIDLLYRELEALGVFADAVFTLKERKQQVGWIDLYDRWFDESLAVLERAGYVKAQGGQSYSVVNAPAVELNAAWSLWDSDKPDWLADPMLKPLVLLVEKMLRALPEILTGRLAATAVMFPDASLGLVETIYQGNPVSDYFNDVVGDALVAYLDSRWSQNAAVRLRILEVGAGTGGTTARVLPKLRGYATRIAEYCYTDVSQAFLLHAQAYYAPDCAFLTTAIFDVEKAPDEQAIGLGAYDLVIATNVLHATKNIRATLRHVKAALRKNGLLILNEMSCNPVSGHLTFGFLKGWWLAEDRHLRIPGSPALSPDLWREVLSDVGFGGLYFPVEHAHVLGNQIIIAESDGIARSRQPAFIPTARPEISVNPKIEPALPVSLEPLSDALLREKTTAYFKKLVGGTLKIPENRIDSAKALEKYGIDSILVIQLTNAMNKVFTGIGSTLFFEYQTIDALAEHFIATRKPALLALLGLEEGDRSDARDQPQPHTEARPHNFAGIRRESMARTVGVQDVAVIGLAGRYPMADNVDVFWRNLAEGKNCIREIPAERWDWRRYFDQEKGKEGTMYSKWGGFIDDIDKFDPKFFQISPREAELMDPQERLFLETAWHGIEDASYTPAALSKSASGKVGVFVGVMNSAYSRQPAYASIANRVSYLLDFHGPSIAVDTACSSSLTAIHLALESLYSGTSECAIAGGVNLIVDPVQYLRLSAMTVLSPGDRCRSFGDGADGIVDGEGVGAIVLKPLAQALADNDQIYGVIKGSLVNAGGKTHGYTVPNPKAQARLIGETLRRAGIGAKTVSYIEAHGTGTILGDPIEIAGLTRAFGEETEDKQFCALGSAKSNIGHCESAAGIAGLTKILLQLKHRQLAPSLHSGELNPNIDFAATPFFVNQSLRAWPAPVIDGKAYPRRAGVSSFGAGGANAHVIVEEYQPPVASARLQPRPAVVLLSAANAECLRDCAGRLLAFIQTAIQRGEPQLADIAYTLQVGRVALAQRFGVIVESIDELAEKLQGFLADGELQEGIVLGRAQSDSETLGLFSADEELQEAVEKWFRRGKYGKLLALWAQGLDFDWNKLYGEHKPRRMSLPAYPFARERYWLKDEGGHRQPAALLHPLLHENISTLEEQCFKTVLTGVEFFLSDHRVQGQSILPGVAYLEMARAAVEKSVAWPEQPGQASIIRLKNIVWVRPVIVRQSTDVYVALAAEEDGQLVYQIYTEPGEAEEAVLHGQGIAIVQAAVEPRFVDIPALLDAINRQSFDAEACYAAYRAMGIDYGPAHRGVETIYTGDRQVLAKLVLPAVVAETQTQFVLHPALMDSALQSAVGFMLATADAESGQDTVLPFALDELDIFAACTESMWAWIRQASSPGETLKLDIDVCDEDGKVCVSMKGFSSRALSGKAEPNPQRGHVSVQDSGLGNAGSAQLEMKIPVWNAVKLREEGEVFPAMQSPLLIAGGNPAQRKALQDLYPSARFWDIAAHDGIEQLIERLSALTPVDHLVWIAPDSRIESMADESLIDAQHFGVGQVFRIIKALLATGYAVRELAWTLITTQTQAVRKKDAIFPAHAGVHGLAGSLAKEYPHWRIRLLDMAADSQWPLAQMFSLPADQRGDALAYRGREWYRQALVPLHRPPPGQGVYRDHGVYVVIGGAGGIGAAWSRAMIARYRAQIIWIGRRQEDAEIRQKRDALAQLGPAPLYIEADAADLSALEKAYQVIRQNHTQIHGLIHSAIVLQDQSLANMDEQRFKAGLSAKVDVSVRLAQVFGQEALDFVLFFSSAVAFAKAPGQSNYAAGCTFKDAFARQLAKQWPCPVKTMNWGYWGSVGIVKDSAYRDRMARAGLGSIEPDEGMDALDSLLQGPIEQMALLKTINPAATEGMQ